MTSILEACYQKIRKIDWKNPTVSYIDKEYSVKLSVVWQWYNQYFCYQVSATLVSAFCIKLYSSYT